MPPSGHTRNSPGLKKPEYPSQHSRSLPYKSRFIVAILFSLLFYLGIIALITSAVAFFFVSAEFKKISAEILIACLGISLVTWLISYVKRRGALCPFCKSTPFADNLARKHEKAFRLRPLNYGTTAILTALFLQRWRCMYCGISFDLRKTQKKGQQ
jgi:uncharacterized membrane protein (DUF485 family)